MSWALERHRVGEAVVIPVIVHPCDWQNTPLGQLRATPPDGKPISKHPNLHDAYLAVVEDIRSAAQRFTDDTDAQPGPRKSVCLPGTGIGKERSSNLRVRREFTDKERDDFLDTTFDYVANYFEESLNELGRRNPAIEARYKRLDLTRFAASVYSSGVKRCSCRIWLGAPFNSTGIAYAANDSGSDNSFGEILTVEDDGYSLVLQPMMGTTYSGTSEERRLTKQGAAEALWSLFIGPMQ